MAIDETETAEYSTDQFQSFVPAGESDPITAQEFGGSDIEIAAITHRGKIRAINEDHYVVVRRTRGSTVLATSLEEDSLPTEQQHSWLLAVADGLGGKVAGEVASESAIRSILKFSNGLSSWIMRPVDRLRDDMAERVDLYVQAIQQDLQIQASRNPELEGMATTLTVIYIFGPSAIVVNIGDSRAYIARNQKLHQITRDHTVAQEMVDEGAGEETAQPFRNVLTRCFNTDGEPVDVDLFHLDLIPGDRLMLCSDGLTDLLADSEIEPGMLSSRPVGAICEDLVSQALDRGGRDNVTIIVGRM